jgi:penicillin-binding protein 1A
MDGSIHKAERLDRRGRRFIAAAVLGAVVIIGASWFGLLAFLGSNSAWGTVEEIRDEWIPDVENLALDLPDIGTLSEVYTADGVLLGLLTERNSQPLSLEEIPNLVIGAVLSAEDAEFMEHIGVDAEAIARAFVSNLRGGSTTQGGSTITQQVVKQNFIGTEATLERKVAEAVIAIELERRYTKEQILEFYLNSVFFGNNAYGVQAAAEVYFGKNLDELTIAEAAAIPVPIRNPSLYDLRRDDTDISLRARNFVIDEMVQEGYITATEGARAKLEPLTVVPPQETLEVAPQVLIAAKDTILNDSRFGLGNTFLQRKRSVFGCPADDTECEGGGGLRIYTTVDYGLQQVALEVLRDWFNLGADGPTGAIAMVDNRTGATIVMASGLEFGSDIEAGQREYDLATKGRRNPGSAFKPFGLTAALEAGIPLNSFWDMSTPQFLDFGGIAPWECNNNSNNPPGVRSLEDALVFSTNTVFCQVAVQVGGSTIKDVAHRLGIRSPLGDFPSIVLGAYAVSPLEMAAAYSTFANYGERVENYLIERIEDADGNVIYQHEVARERVLEEALAGAVVNTLEQAASRGTGTNSFLGRPQAGKTGTHQGHTDVWFMGFIPQYTTAVWVGFPDSQVEMRNITINGTFYARAFGGSIAAPIWQDFMEIVVNDLPVQDFRPDPSGISVYYQTPRVPVPNVIGLDLDDAEEEILRAGLEPVAVVVNSNEPQGEVVGQDPRGGSRVTQGSEVEIEVSSGRSPETVMPNLYGASRSQARDILLDLRDETEIDFDWVFEDVITNNRDENNRVVSTTPRSGQKVRDGTTVVIRIGRFEDGG